MIRFSAFVAFAVLSQAAFCQAPSNNGCASPIAVAYGVNPGAPIGTSGTTYTNVGATDTLSSFLPDEASCTGGPDTFNNDVWFSFTPTITGVHRVSTCTPPGFAPGTLEDTVVAVYSTTAMSWSCSSSTSWTEIGCADEECDSLAEARVTLTAGTSYRIRVGSWDSSASGTFYLTIGGPTTSNTCSVPTLVTLGTTFANNYGASSTAIAILPSSASCTGGPGSLTDDVWFQFTPAVSGAYSIDTFTFDSDVVSLVSPPMALYSNINCAAAAGTVEIACTPDADFISIEACLTAGVPYAIRVGSSSANTEGTFLLNIYASPMMCLQATSPLGNGSLSLNLTGGTPNALYFTCITTNPVGFPNAWLFGIAPTLTEVSLQLGSNAAPFVGLLDSSGNRSFGPVAGLPSFTFYGVSMTFNVNWQIIDISPPIAYTIL